MSSRKSVLIVEDDVLQAMDLEFALTDAGLEVLGPAPDATTALSLLSRDAPDFAILDYNLGQSTSAEVAALLSAQAIPFVYLTGRPESVLGDEACPKAHVFAKPYNQRVLSRISETLGSC